MNTGFCPAESRVPGNQCAFKQISGTTIVCVSSHQEAFHVKCQLRQKGWMIYKGYKKYVEQICLHCTRLSITLVKSMPALTQHFGQRFRS